MKGAATNPEQGNARFSLEDQAVRALRDILNDPASTPAQRTSAAEAILRDAKARPDRGNVPVQDMPRAHLLDEIRRIEGLLAAKGL